MALDDLVRDLPRLEPPCIDDGLGDFNDMVWLSGFEFDSQVADDAAQVRYGDTEDRHGRWEVRLRELPARWFAHGTELTVNVANDGLRLAQFGLFGHSENSGLREGLYGRAILRRPIDAAGVTGVATAVGRHQTL